MLKYIFYESGQNMYKCIHNQHGTIFCETGQIIQKMHEYEKCTSNLLYALRLEIVWLKTHGVN